MKGCDARVDAVGAAAGWFCGRLAGVQKTLLGVAPVVTMACLVIATLGVKLVLGAGLDDAGMLLAAGV